MSRTLEELVDKNDPGWPLVQEWIADAEVSVEVLPKEPKQSAQALLDTQVTTRSPMGAIIYESGGLLIDHGWLRMLGSGHPRMTRSLPGWNAQTRKVYKHELNIDDPRVLFIGDDVLGGFYALDGGGLGEGNGEVFYFGPDTLDWQNLNLKFTPFLQQMMSGAIRKFYSNLRWTGWESESDKTNGDKAISMYPFLWTVEGQDPSKNSRTVVSITEIFLLHLIEFPKQLGPG